MLSLGAEYIMIFWAMMAPDIKESGYSDRAEVKGSTDAMSPHQFSLAWLLGRASRVFALQCSFDLQNNNMMPQRQKSGAFVVPEKGACKVEAHQLLPCLAVVMIFAALIKKLLLKHDSV